MKKIIYLILFVSTSLSMLCQNSNPDKEFVYKIDSLDKYPSINILQLIDLLPSSKVESNSVIFRNLKQQNFLSINGFDIGDPIFGGFGQVDASQYPAPSIYALDKLESTPNAVSASNTNNMGMVLNMNLRKGNPYKFEVFGKYTGTIPALYGSTDRSYKVAPLNGSLNLAETSNGLKYQSSADRNIEFGFGGPLLFDKKSSFFISYRNYYRDCNAGLEVYDPGNNNLGKLPNQRTFASNLTGTLNSIVFEKLSVELDGMYGVSAVENSSLGWLYATTPSINNDMPERDGKLPAQNYKTSFINLKIMNNIKSNLNYQLQLGISTNAYEYGRKGSSSDPGVLSGFDIKKPVDDYSFRDSTYSTGANGLLDDYETSWILSNSKDGFYRKDYPIKNPFSGYYEGIINSSSNNPYGLSGYFITEGTPSTTVSFLDATKFTASAELGYAYSIFDVPNITTIGLNYSAFVYDKYIASFKDYSFQYYVNSEKYDAGYKKTADSSEFNRASNTIKPYFGGAFIENTLKSEHFQIDLGLRFDYFNSNYESLIKDIDRKKPEIYVSPRIQMKYNVGSHEFSFGYGNFYMMHTLNSLVNYNSSYLDFSQVYSNPYLEPINTKSIELTYNSTPFWNIELHTAIYKNWVKNGLSIGINNGIPSIYSHFSSYNEMTNQGLELVLYKYFNRNFDLSMNYSYSLSETNDSQNGQVFAVSMFPSYYNIPHKFNLILNLKTNEHEGIEVFGFNPFENINLAFISKVYSGYPYTKTDRNGRQIEPENASTWPSNVFFDLRLSKKIFFGVTSNSYIAFSLDIYNLLNSSFQTAKEEYSNLIARKQTDISHTVYYDKGEIGNPESFSGDQYDKIGNRLYSKNADYNSDGIVTAEEKYTSLARYAQDIVNLQNHMSSLRSAFFNITIGF